MIKEGEATAIVAGDNATFTAPIGGDKRDKKSKKDKKDTLKFKRGELPMTVEGKTIFEDNDDWSFYNDNDMNVFEIKNNNAKDVYQMGLKRGQANFWKQNDTTNQMLQHLNTNRSRNFVVRFDGQDSFPLMKGF